MSTKLRSITTVAAFAFLVGAAQAPPSPERRAASVLSYYGVQQIALTCTDLDRAIVFYRDTLGLPLLFVTNGMAFFDVGGTRLMIAADKARPTLPRPTSVIYFDTPDFEASLQRLRAIGLPLTGGVEAVQHSDRGDLKLQQFEDPDHNMLAIMGWVPAGG
jgi:catechol 2,3-dioxygenase-like lactoylglutathione lyase family enzyme